MKKKSALWIGILILSITACAISFLHSRDRLQAVFLSFGTALQKDASFAVRNMQTNNVYILQTSRNQQALSLYRRREDGKLLRYKIQNKTAETSVAGQSGWLNESMFELPENPYLLLQETEEWFKGKSKTTDIAKLYFDMLFSFISTVNSDSSLLIDYEILPDAFLNISALLKEKETKQQMDLQKKKNGTQTVYTIQPFADEQLRLQIAEILTQAITQEHKSDIKSAVLHSLLSMQDHKLQITVSAFGSFCSMRILKDDTCIFSVEKLK